jgi:hypothetical protein
MPIAQLTPLPDAPSRNDAPENFTAKADASLAAQKRMVTEFNQAIGGINDFSDTTTSNKGAALIGFVQNLNGATGRNTASKLRDIVSVKDFGAKGDSTSDDTAAIQAAFNSGKAIFFPEGDYKVTAGLTLPDNHVCITGSGPKKSRILVNHTSTAISYTSTDRRRQAVFKDIGIVSLNASSTLALEVIFPETTGVDQIQLIAENLSISREGEGVWATGGVRCQNVTNPIFSKFVITGTYATTQYGISFEGQCLDSSITQSRFYLLQNGVKIGGTSEGLTISEAAIVGVRTGVNAQSSGYEPWLALTNTHINATERCIKTVNRSEMTISNCLLYSGNAFNDTSDWAAIDIASSGSIQTLCVQISNTQFNKSSFTGTTTGIIVNNAQWVEIDNCIFGPMGVGIALTNVTNYKISPNTLFNSVTSPITVDSLPCSPLLSMDYSVKPQNTLTIQGSVSGGSPTVGVTGVDTNVGINISAKGSGTISLIGAGNGVAFRAIAPASSVNRVRAVASAAGAAVQLQAEGSDTNISLQLAPKGTGAVIPTVRSYADDAAAASGGISVGGMYHTNGVLKIRLS